ncbi:MAG: hypothetical protein HYV96_17450 [Opitutae bacterium]|nr:hypothetical protein [Opitutae bacterium]
MKIFKWIVGVAVVAATLTTGGLTYRQKQQDGEIRRLRSENNRLRGEAYRRQATATARVAPAASETVHTSRAKPAEAAARKIEEYRNEGRASARATLQTLAWCCDRADVEALKGLVQPEPQAQAKAEAFYANLPSAGRGQWKSADEMVASFVMLAAQMSPFPSADVLDAAVMEPQGADVMLLRLPGTRKDRLPFRRGADGSWGCVIDARTMDGLLAMAKDLASTTR